MASYKKLGKNIISLTIGSFASKLLSFFFVPFYTSILSTKEYGTADLITTTVSLLFPFFSLIICESMMRFAQEKTEDKEQIFSIGMWVSGIGFIILLICSPLLLLISSLKSYWILVVLYYFAYSLNSNIGYFVRGIEKVVTYSIGGIINTFITVFLNILFLLYFKIGVLGYLLSFIIANIVAAFYMMISAKIYTYKYRKIDKQLLHRMLKYSLPMIPNSASWWISNSSDKYILTFFIGVAANGIYSVAYKIPTIISMLTSIFSTAWRLSAVEEFGTEESRKFYSDVFDMYITITLCASSGLMLINKPLAHFLYSKDFYQAWKFVPILLISAVIHAYADFFGTLYTSAMKTKMLFYSTVSGALGNIILNFILIPKLGGLGAAIATMISYLIVFVVRLIHSRSIMRLNYNSKNNICCFIFVLMQLTNSTFCFINEYIISSICLIFIIFMRKRRIVQTINIIFKKNI